MSLKQENNKVECLIGELKENFRKKKGGKFNSEYFIYIIYDTQI